MLSSILSQLSSFSFSRPPVIGRKVWASFSPIVVAPETQDSHKSRLQIVDNLSIQRMGLFHFLSISMSASFPPSGPSTLFTRPDLLTILYERMRSSEEKKSYSISPFVAEGYCWANPVLAPPTLPSNLHTGFIRSIPIHCWGYRTFFSCKYLPFPVTSLFNGDFGPWTSVDEKTTYVFLFQTTITMIGNESMEWAQNRNSVRTSWKASPLISLAENVYFQRLSAVFQVPLAMALRTPPPIGFISNEFQGMVPTVMWYLGTPLRFGSRADYSC